MMLVKMRLSSPRLAIVAREHALRLIELSFPPDAVHTPGVAHIVADRLSRVFAPGGEGRVNNQLHAALGDAEQTHALGRKDRCYRDYNGNRHKARG